VAPSAEMKLSISNNSVLKDDMNKDNAKGRPSIN